MSGVSTLFSQEFYKQITRYLEPDGLLVQWIQIYETDLDIVVSVAKALAPEFADFAIYNADDSNILIVATPAGTLRAPDSRPFDSPELRAEMARVGLMNLRDLRSRFLGSKKLLAPLLAASGVPANSDYFPVPSTLNAPRARILNRNAVEFVSALRRMSVPFFELLDGTRDSRTPDGCHHESHIRTGCDDGAGRGSCAMRS